MNMEKYVKTARTIVKNGGCSGVACIDCPSAQGINGNTYYCTDNEFYSGDSRCINMNEVFIDAFKNFIKENEIKENNYMVTMFNEDKIKFGKMSSIQQKELKSAYNGKYGDECNIQYLNCDRLWTNYVEDEFPLWCNGCVYRVNPKYVSMVVGIYGDSFEKLYSIINDLTERIEVLESNNDDKTVQFDLSNPDMIPFGRMDEAMQDEMKRSYNGSADCSNIQFYAPFFSKWYTITPSWLNDAVYRIAPDTINKVDTTKEDSVTMYSGCNVLFVDDDNEVDDTFISTADIVISNGVVIKNKFGPVYCDESDERIEPVTYKVGDKFAVTKGPYCGDVFTMVLSVDIDNTLKAYLYDIDKKGTWNFPVCVKDPNSITVDEFENITNGYMDYFEKID